jgi:pyruvate kinase
MKTKTKIIATIGPASNNKTVLKKMISAGMNAVRLNFSHGTYEEHTHVINTIRSLSRTMSKPIGIILDLQGPKIRTGKMKDGKPVELRKNKTLRITTKSVAGSADIVSTNYKKLVDDVRKDDKILLDDGLIELRALSKTKDTVSCKIINGGVLKEHKGINLPGVNISSPSLTPKDKRDLNFGIKSGVDYFALSFVRRADDPKQIKSMIEKQGSDIPVIAKIEKPEAVDNIDEILEAADGIMVARGDLGVELKPEKVPTIQKHIIHKAILAKKPVITATQMLETMVDNPIPTRAEASDVANAIYDGTDAIMLSGETSSGKYPLKAVQMMSRIAAEAEGSYMMKYNIQYDKDPESIVSHAVAQASVNILHEVNAKAIIAFSVSGQTSKLISKQRPSKPVYAFTPSTAVYNRMSLIWGITSLYVPSIYNTERIIDSGEKLLLNKKLIKNDDLIVIVTGLALKRGSTNLIKIHRVGHKD